MIQESDVESTMPAPCRCTEGGSTVVRNGDEDNAPSAAYQRISVRRATGMFAEDDASCQGVYRKSDV